MRRIAWLESEIKALSTASNESMGEKAGERERRPKIVAKGRAPVQAENDDWALS